ncbi:MAG: hypothetical protein JST52_00735 [Bacteroidetes bacterium]|nr:hypothetical protein [Bacteroidota bacterium]MBS1740326.1 hypothetical protein [Bacteroidota bacterium]MBS1776853.1 hypothetical protein [Bacteroidota bacterium]
MKKILNLFALSAIAIVVTMGSCKKKESTDNGLSSDINNIISQDIINDLQGRGMIINKGNTPPSISGVFLVSPFTLQNTYDGDLWTVGKVISDYKYRFYDQSGTNIKMDYKGVAVADNAVGMGSFLSGSDTKFTLFAQSTGNASGINYKNVSIISGEFTASGIKNFQYAFVLTQKDGDEANAVLMPVGKSRIWRDGDGLAVPSSSFKMISSNGVPAGLMMVK